MWCLIVGNFLIRLPWVNMPAYHDETFYFDGARTVMNNNLWPWVSFGGYKGPVVYEPVAFLMGFGGIYRFWARLLIYGCSSLGIWLTYKLGKRISKSEDVGLASAGLLFLMPLFMIHSNLYTDAIPLMVVFLLTLNCLLEDKINKYFFYSVMLVLTKETAIFIPALLYFLKKRWSVVVVPVVGFGLWLVMNKVTLGFFLLPYSAGLLWSDGWQSRLISGLTNWGSLFWLTAVVVLVAAMFNKKKIDKKVMAIFLGMYLFYNLIYGVTYFNQRYLLVVVPLVIVVAAYLVKVSFGNRYLWGWFWVTSIMMALVQAWQWKSGNIAAGIDDLRVLKNIGTQKEVADYLVEKYPNGPVLVGWPMSSYLSDNFYGYVKKAVPIVSFGCDGKPILVDEKVKAVVLSRMNCNIGVVAESSWRKVKEWNDGLVIVYEK